MKSLSRFLFAYKHLDWKTRLSWRDYLYHQGRNTLAMILVIPLLIALATVLTFRMGPAGDLSFTNPLNLALMLGGGALVLVLIYLGVAAFKLAAMRLHDLGFSAWWLLALIPVLVLDGFLEWKFPAVQNFFSVQNTISLALLLWPAAMVVNRFGNADVNDTTGKPRWVRAVPLVVFFAVWVLGMVSVFVSSMTAQSVMGQAGQTQLDLEGSNVKLEEMQEYLRQNQAEQEALQATINGQQPRMETDAPTNLQPSH